jgi:hypothetical protein
MLELKVGSFEFVDNFGNKRTGAQRLFPSATVLGGKPVAPRQAALVDHSLTVMARKTIVEGAQVTEPRA